MDLCSDGHPEIVHNSRDCPLCAALQDAKDLQREITSLENDLYEAKNE